MDVEEPEAAMIISVSLNKKNEASMKTSHTEIMNTLVGLCAPSPNDVESKVPFEPVREKMIEYYGASVDHPEFYHAFRVVMDAGGHDSLHMADLHEFTKVYVNPKLRNMRFEADGVVSVYPVPFPRIKKRLPEVGLEAAPKERVVRVGPQHFAQVLGNGCFCNDDADAGHREGIPLWEQGRIRGGGVQ